MKRMIMMVALAAFLVAALSVSALSAFAAPITCPSGQTVTKTATGWTCVNNAGSGNPNTENPKNPNR
jgi:ABC-type proline/glycine betaine transport system substrate-binding protein